MKPGRSEAGGGRRSRRGTVLAALAAALFLAPAAAAQAVNRAGAGAPQRPTVELFFGRSQASWLSSLKTGLVPATGAELERRAAGQALRQRNQDVFGLRMYPREESPVVAADAQAPVVRTIERVTLNEALQTLTPNGVNLGRRELMLDGQTARVGDALHLTYKGQTFLAEILEVGLTAIRFRDVKRRENGVLPHTCVPLFAPEKLTRRGVDPDRLPGKVRPMEPTR